jgi:glycosyltransferase involved in cell wall biosynthesis
MPSVSVIVPIYNEPRVSLFESLNSIKRQTLSDFECLLIDDSSEEDTLRTCADFCTSDSRFKHYRPEHRLGLAGSLNYGIHIASAPLIARFDADDFCIPERLKKQVEFMDNNPEVAVLGGWMEIINSSGGKVGLRKYPIKNSEIQRKLHYTNTLAHPTVIMRRSVVLACGNYKQSLESAEDLDLWLRMSGLGYRFANLPEVLVIYKQDITIRKNSNWKSNLLVRLNNIRISNLGDRVLGIVLISAWCMFPESIRRIIYKRTIMTLTSDL